MYVFFSSHSLLYARLSASQPFIVSSKRRVEKRIVWNLNKMKNVLSHFPASIEINKERKKKKGSAELRQVK